MFDNQKGRSSISLACLLLQIIHLKRFQFVNGHWVKSNKIVQFPMEGFDPSAFLAKRPSSTTSSSDSTGVTTVNVKSSEEREDNDEETGENRQQTPRQGSEVILANCSKTIQEKPRQSTQLCPYTK